MNECTNPKLNKWNNLKTCIEQQRLSSVAKIEHCHFCNALRKLANRPYVAPYERILETWPGLEASKKAKKESHE